MNRGLIITLILACIVTAIFVIRKIKKSQFKIGDTLYWLFFCLFLLVMSIFPTAIYWVSNIIGFESPSNFIFVTIIFLLLVKIFLLDARVAKVEDKLIKLVQKYAIDNESKETK
ncbi:MAG: DUF2304 domain-containing protein [Clostridia bacterium]|nr:DUF2304 domain-containing protein [Clostridia bacterium]